MKVEDVTKYCLSFPAATEREDGHPSNILSFYVANKKFAYFKTSEPEKWRFSIRTTPNRFIELTDQPGIKPARYMHRFHWVTIVDVSMMYEAHLIELIAWSYSKAFTSLSKKLQNEIQPVKE